VERAKVPRQRMNGFGRTMDWPPLQTTSDHLHPEPHATSFDASSPPGFPNSTPPGKDLPCASHLANEEETNFLSLIFSLTGCMYAARRLSSDLVFSTYARNPDLEEDSSTS
jgi:hypothetical protein